MDNKDDIINAMLEEISEKTDQKEKGARDLADMLWVYYQAFASIGFTEERAFTLTGIFLNTILSRIVKG